MKLPEGTIIVVDRGGSLDCTSMSRCLVLGADETRADLAALRREAQARLPAKKERT